MIVDKTKNQVMRVISSLTLGFFLISQVVFANPDARIEIAGNREVPGFLQIDIPAELATLDGMWQAPPSSNSKVILHIQNAHANYGAQKKIKGLLEYLHKTYDIKTVFVEGAAEDLNPDYLKLFPDKERNLELADLLAQQGELTGAELYLLETNDPAVKGKGIEAAGLYRNNYEALKKVFGAEPLANRYLQGYESRLDALSSKIFPSDLRRVLSEWKKFEKGHREFMPYVRSLAADARRILKFDLESLFSQVEWPQITRLLALQTMEKELDTAKALEEKDKLVAFLKAKDVSPRLVSEVENSKEQRLSVRQGQEDLMRTRDILEALAREAGPRGFSFGDYPYFSLYAGYLILKSELDAKGLFEEIKVLFERILDSLAVTPEQTSLLELYRDEELARKLLSLELSRREWQQAHERKAQIGMDSLIPRLKDLSRAVTQAMKLAPSDLEVRKLSPQFREQVRGLYDAAFSFYEFARQREAMFYEKINAVMIRDSTNKAVLITGGFHTDGMTDLFREHDVSYGLLTPRLMEKSDEKMYRNTMLQNEGQLFSISYLELANACTSLATQALQGLNPGKRLSTQIKNFWRKLPREEARDGEHVAEAFNRSIAAREQSLDGQTKGIRLTHKGKDANGRDLFQLEGLPVFEGKRIRVTPPVPIVAGKRSEGRLNMETRAPLTTVVPIIGNVSGGVASSVVRSEAREGVATPPHLIRSNYAQENKPEDYAIDPAIRGVMEKMNKLPLETGHSCSGHVSSSSNLWESLPFVMKALLFPMFITVFIFRQVMNRLYPNSNENSDAYFAFRGRAFTPKEQLTLDEVMRDFENISIVANGHRIGMSYQSHIRPPGEHQPGHWHVFRMTRPKYITPRVDMYMAFWSEVDKVVESHLPRGGTAPDAGGNAFARSEAREREPLPIFSPEQVRVSRALPSGVGVEQRQVDQNERLSRDLATALNSIFWTRLTGGPLLEEQQERLLKNTDRGVSLKNIQISIAPSMDMAVSSYDRGGLSIELRSADGESARLDFLMKLATYALAQPGRRFSWADLNTGGSIDESVADAPSKLLLEEMLSQLEDSGNRRIAFAAISNARLEDFVERSKKPTSSGGIDIREARALIDDINRYGNGLTVRLEYGEGERRSEFTGTFDSMRRDLERRVTVTFDNGNEMTFDLERPLLRMKFEAPSARTGWENQRSEMRGDAGEDQRAKLIRAAQEALGMDRFLASEAGIAAPGSYQVYGERDGKDPSILDHPRQGPSQEMTARTLEAVLDHRQIGYDTKSTTYFYLPRDMDLPKFLRDDLAVKERHGGEAAVSIGEEESVNLTPEDIREGFRAGMIKAESRRFAGRLLVDYSIEDAETVRALKGLRTQEDAGFERGLNRDTMTLPFAGKRNEIKTISEIYRLIVTGQAKIGEVGPFLEGFIARSEVRGEARGMESFARRLDPLGFKEKNYEVYIHGLTKSERKTYETSLMEALIATAAAYKNERTDDGMSLKWQRYAKPGKHPRLDFIKQNEIGELVEALDRAGCFDPKNSEEFVHKVVERFAFYSTGTPNPDGSFKEGSEPRPIVWDPDAKPGTDQFDTQQEAYQLMLHAVTVIMKNQVRPDSLKRNLLQHRAMKFFNMFGPTVISEILYDLIVPLVLSLMTKFALGFFNVHLPSEGYVLEFMIGVGLTHFVFDPFEEKTLKFGKNWQRYDYELAVANRMYEVAGGANSENEATYRKDIQRIKERYSPDPTAEGKLGMELLDETQKIVRTGLSLDGNYLRAASNGYQGAIQGDDIRSVVIAMLVEVASHNGEYFERVMKSLEMKRNNPMWRLWNLVRMNGAASQAIDVLLELAPLANMQSKKVILDAIARREVAKEHAQNVAKGHVAMEIGRPTHTRKVDLKKNSLLLENRRNYEEEISRYLIEKIASEVKSPYFFRVLKLEITHPIVVVTVKGIQGGLNSMFRLLYKLFQWNWAGKIHFSWLRRHESPEDRRLVIESINAYLSSRLVSVAAQEDRSVLRDYINGLMGRTTAWVEGLRNAVEQKGLPFYGLEQGQLEEMILTLEMLSSALVVTRSEVRKSSQEDQKARIHALISNEDVATGNPIGNVIAPALDISSGVREILVNPETTAGTAARSEERVTKPEKDVVAVIRKALKNGERVILEGTSFSALKEIADSMGVKVGDLSPEVQVTLLLTRGLAPGGNMEAAIRVLAQVAVLVDNTDFVKKLKRAVPHSTVPLSDKSGKSARLVEDGFKNRESADQFFRQLFLTYLLNPNVDFRVLVLGGSVSVEQILDSITAIAKEFKKPGFARKVKVAVMGKSFEPGSSKARGFLSGYVVSGTEEAFNQLGFISFDAVNAFRIWEDKDPRVSSDPRVWSAVVRAAQSIKAGGLVSSSENIKLLKQVAESEEQPGFVFQNENKRFMINLMSLNVLKNIAALYVAFQQISKAA